MVRLVAINALFDMTPPFVDGFQTGVGNPQENGAFYICIHNYTLVTKSRVFG